MRRGEGFLPRGFNCVVRLVGRFDGSLFLLERLDTVLTAKHLREIGVTKKADRIVASERSLHDSSKQASKHGSPSSLYPPLIQDMHISDDGRAGQRRSSIPLSGLAPTRYGATLAIWRQVLVFLSLDIHHSYLIYFRTRRTSESRPQGYKPSLPGRPATAKARHSSSHVSLTDHMTPSILVPCSLVWP